MKRKRTVAVTTVGDVCCIESLWAFSEGFI
jgi:hypothetical protein